MKVETEYLPAATPYTKEVAPSELHPEVHAMAYSTPLMYAILEVSVKRAAKWCHLPLS